MAHQATALRWQLQRGYRTDRIGGCLMVWSRRKSLQSYHEESTRSPAQSVRSYCSRRSPNSIVKRTLQCHSWSVSRAKALKLMNLTILSAWRKIEKFFWTLKRFEILRYTKEADSSNVLTKKTFMSLFVEMNTIIRVAIMRFVTVWQLRLTRRVHDATSDVQGALLYKPAIRDTISMTFYKPKNYSFLNFLTKTIPH